MPRLTTPGPRTAGRRARRIPAVLLLLLLPVFPPSSLAGDTPGLLDRPFVVAAREGRGDRILGWTDWAPGQPLESTPDGVARVMSVGAKLSAVRDDPRREDWLRRLTAAARTLGDGAPIWLLDLHPADPDDVQARAFLHKAGAVAVRGGNEAAIVLLGGVESAAGLEALYAQDLAAYVDGVVGGLPDSQEPEHPFLSVLRERDINPHLWILGGEDPAGDTLRALATGASGILLSGQGEGAGRLAALLPSESSLRSARLERAGDGGAGLTLRRGPGPVLLVRILDLESFSTLLLYRKGATTEEGIAEEPPRLVVDVAGFGRPRLEDLTTGEPLDPGLVIEEPRAGTTAFNLPGEVGHLVAVRFAERELVERGERAEELRVRGESLPPVEKVLAAHQAWQAEQDERLQSYVAELSNTMNFSVSGAGREATLGIRSRLYVAREQEPQYENLQYFFNGAPVKQERVPNLPLVQPEKVKTLPLDLNLGKAYSYGLEARTQMGGRTAYRVRFEPLSETRPAFQGQVWIDAADGSLLRLQAVQIGVEPPVLSYEQIQEFSDWQGPEGTFRLPETLRVQQTFNTLGATVTARATIAFTDYRINPEDYGAQLTKARRSDRQMLQDTEEGLRYLVKDPETGERVVQEDLPQRSRFWIAGLRYDRSLDFPVPLAGVNYLNFDWRGRGLQTNLFLAGLVNRISVSQPSIGGSPWGWDAQIGINLIPFQDNAFDDEGRELEEEDVRAFNEEVELSLSRPFGGFFKASGTLALEYLAYDDTDDTRDGFRIPQDHLATSLGGAVDFRRGGWGVDLWGNWTSRSSWEAWGLEEDPPAPRESFEDSEDFLRYGASVEKRWRLRGFQKLGARIEWMDGQDLDRFSRFEAGTFAHPVAGFDGSGLRWDTGAILRLSYGWSLLDLAGLDVRLDWARVRNEGVSDEFFDNQGVALGGSFQGPKGSILNFSLGVAVNSDLYPDAEGNVAGQILLLRLF